MRGQAEPTPPRLEPELSAGRRHIRRASTRATLGSVSNLEKRGGYTPRRVREQRAQRLVAVGAGAGALGGIGIVLAVFGVIEATWPIVLIIVAVMCAAMFRSTVTRR